MDLHVHTHFSACYDDHIRPEAKRRTTADEIVQTAVAIGLDGMAITDHNGVEMITTIADLARGRGGPPVALDMARKTSVNTALYAALTAGRIDAHTALRLGLVHEVLPPEDLMPHALELAEKIAGFSQPSLRSIKRALYLALESGYPDAMKEAGMFDRQARSSSDLCEGTIAFDEKRRPRYQHDV